MPRFLLRFLCFFLTFYSINVFPSDLDLEGDFTQGGMLIGTVPQGALVRLNGKEVKVSGAGKFVVGFGRDAELEHILTWSQDSSNWQERKISLVKREYNIQRIDGVPQKYVTPSEDKLARIRAETALVKQARKTDLDDLHFLGSFIRPAEGPLTGVYGSQRVFNGTPKRPHFGLDIAGPVGAEIIAPAAGTVTLVHNDMYYSGGTLIVDHGFGISSTFIHLSKITVEEGEKVAQGQKIAEMGATGRVTGPHLDWRMNWFDTRLDPALVLED